MTRSSCIAAAALVVVLAGASCLPPQEEVVSSQRTPKWGEADPAVLNATEDPSEPDIRPETHIAAAALFESQGLHVKAITQYQKAIAVRPKHPEAYTRLGILLGRIGQHESAERYLHQAVELSPRSAPLRNNLGFEYALQERWMDAETEIRNAIQLKPDFKRAYINLGMVLCKQGRFDEGLEAFEQAVPTADAYYNLGLMLRSARQYAKAADAFTQALQIDPQLTAAQTQLEQIATRIPEPAAAEPPSTPTLAEQPAAEPILEPAPPPAEPLAATPPAEPDSYEPMVVTPDDDAVAATPMDPPAIVEAKEPEPEPEPMAPGADPEPILPIGTFIDQVASAWDILRCAVDEASLVTVQPIADEADGPPLDPPFEEETGPVFLTARPFIDLMGPFAEPPILSADAGPSPDTEPRTDDDPILAAVIETLQAIRTPVESAGSKATDGERVEVLCEDWLKLNWAFDEDAPPVILRTACENEPDTFTPQLRFDPRWHIVRPGAISLEQNPYEEVETFHPVTWELPRQATDND